MTLEYILRAAVNSMINGKHSPHCYSAHVPGKGYVNDGSAQYDRAEYGTIGGHLTPYAYNM